MFTCLFHSSADILTLDRNLLNICLILYLKAKFYGISRKCDVAKFQHVTSQHCCLCCRMEQEGRIRNVQVHGYQKRYDQEKYYTYILKVERDNQPDPTYLFRTFREFSELQHKLSDKFPLAKELGLVFNNFRLALLWWLVCKVFFSA